MCRPSERTPLEKQLGAMIEKQVYARADVSKSIKGSEKEEYDRLKAKLAELSKDKPAETPVALAMTDLATTAAHASAQARQLAQSRQGGTCPRFPLNRELAGCRGEARR